MAMSPVRSVEAPKFRLRFSLQEFNLQPGITTIGRGDDCHITLFDPSVSRQHARIVVDDRGAVLEDMQSRNGCRVNGTRILAPTVLAEGDRLRIGTQELVFGMTHETSHVQRRDTGSLCYCSACRTAYAKEMNACPHCGATSRGTTVPAELDEDAQTHARRRRPSVPPSR
jgi:predicted component of type VI protein secretion system